MGDKLGDLFTNMQERYQQRDLVAFSDWGKIKEDILKQAPPDSVLKDPKKVDEFIVLGRVLQETVCRCQIITKRPAFIDPPYRSVPIDMYKNIPVLLPPLSPPIPLLRLVIRPGQYAVVNGFANELENLAAHEEVSWSLRVNNEEIVIQTEWFDGVGRDSTYRQFRERLGRIESPFQLPKTFTILGPAEFSITAANTSPWNVHWGRTRITGWMYTPGHVTLDRESPAQMMI